MNSLGKLAPGRNAKINLVLDLMLLAVATEYRRRGVGRALVTWLEREAFEARGAANLFLCVSAFNEPARRFYRCLGYEEVGVLSGYLRPGVDEVLLRKSVRSLLGPAG